MNSMYGWLVQGANRWHWAPKITRHAVFQRICERSWKDGKTAVTVFHVYLSFLIDFFKKTYAPTRSPRAQSDMPAKHFVAPAG